MSPDDGKASFEEFYIANFGRLIKQVQRKKRLRFHDAEDIVQASFTELATQWEKAENPDGLLATIIHRKVIKYWEQQPFSKGVTVAYIGDHAEWLHSNAQDPAVAAEHVDTLRHLNRELHLEPIEQDIILGRAQGLSTAEIASQTETSPARIRQVGRRLKQRATFLTAPIRYDPQGSMESMVMTHVNRLPPRQRDVMTWAVRGYRPSSIAVGLEITANDARVNLAHARKALAAMDAAVAQDAEALIGLRRPMRGKAFLPSPAARTLFGLAVREQIIATQAAHSHDRFLHAHRAAAQAAGAMILARPTEIRPRFRQQSVWRLLKRYVPELSDWATYFASDIGRWVVRARAGLSAVVNSQDASNTLWGAEAFLEHVASTLGIPVTST